MLTLETLKLIKHYLKRVPGCLSEEDRQTCSSCIEVRNIIDLVQREIEINESKPNKHKV